MAKTGLETRVTWIWASISKRQLKYRKLDGSYAGDQPPKGSRHPVRGGASCCRGAAGNGITAKTSKKSSLKLGSHNTRSLANESKREAENNLANYSSCDFIALQETRMSKGCSLITEDGNEFIFLEMINKKVGGLGFWIKKKFRRSVVEVVSCSDRVAILKLKIGETNLALFNMYSPTNNAKQTEVDKFYKMASKAYNSVADNWVRIVCGDFNGAIGKTSTQEHPTVGRYGLKTITRNDNGESLIDFANSKRLAILNTHFKKKRSAYWTWRGPNEKSRSMIDYFMIKESRRFMIRDINTFNSNYNLSDHRLLRLTINVAHRDISRKLRRPRERMDRVVKLDKLEYLRSLDSNLDSNCANYSNLIKTMKECAKHTSIPTPKESRISQETRELLEKRFRILASNQATALEKREICKITRESYQKDLENWRCRKIEEAVAKRTSVKKMKKRIEEKSELFQRLTLQDGSRTSNRSKIREAVKNHFKKQFERTGPKTTKIQSTTRNPLPISNSEVMRAISSLKVNTARGLDGIGADMIKYGGELVAKCLTNSFNKIIDDDEIPDDWNNIRLKLIEKKPNPEHLKDVRPISILSIPGKIFTKVMTSRLMGKSEQTLDESQHGFRPRRSCSDNLQSISILWERSHEYKLPLILTFIDFKAAFDSVDWNSVQESVIETGFWPQYLECIKGANEVGIGELTVLGEKMKIAMERGVRQGDSSSPALFSIALDHLLRQADPIPENDLDGNYGCKIHGQYISRLLFADDLVLIDTSSKDAQKRAENIAKKCEEAGLLFNTSKSKVLRNEAADKRFIVVRGERLEDVDQIKYLGRIFMKDGSLDSEIANRKRSAWAAYHGIAEALSGIGMTRKNQLLKQSVVAAAIYGAETWNTKVKDVEIIQRTINHIWVQAGAGNPPDMTNLIMKTKIRWAGHVARMSPTRYCKIITLSDFPDKYPRRKGRPKKRWVDDIKEAAKVHNHNQNLLGLGGTEEEEGSG
ncbi:unnamed protein product [Caenorhabditis angaria]|uniref:Reverse transcriptase domain-containing protein n=1 Tax=Caenorhabditis angaria TaxID=860376 RepID=A0A9P1IS32_9PELO|nr:unnamed protein product [Caenorhabditis angaria]